VRHSPLALWHLLSLDAPTVAALWTWFIARSCGIALPHAAITAMFLAVWMLYAADRLLDSRNSTDLEERHRFHHRHRRLFVRSIALAAIALAALTPELLPQALRIYALLGALLAAWFLLIHTRLAHERRLPKELAVGFFFSAALFVPTITRRPDLRLQLLAPALLFAAVCALNCMYLYAWEHPDSRANANWTTRAATHHLATISTVLLAIALLCVPLRSLASFAFVFAFPWQITTACAASTALLFVLDRLNLSPIHKRAAADLTLLTPLALAPFLK